MTITHTESFANARIAPLVSPANAARPGLGDGENVCVTSRHGAVEEWKWKRAQRFALQPESP